METNWNRKTNIQSWTAKQDSLEINVHIEPWGKYFRYFRLNSKDAGAYGTSWKWFEGTVESKSTYGPGDEVSAILNKLVLNHGALNLFCHIYGIQETA